MCSIRIPATWQNDQRPMSLSSPITQQAVPDFAGTTPAKISQSGKLSAATLLHVQRTYGNAATRRIVSDHTGGRGCSCLACRPLTRAAVSVQAMTVQRCGVGCGCAACSTEEDDPVSNDSVQRSLWDDDTESDESSREEATSEAEAESTAEAEPTSTDSSEREDADADSGAPFSSDSEPADSAELSEEESEDSSDSETEDAGEVSYGLPTAHLTRPSVTHYGKAGIYDAEGYCKWDSIDSDANNDGIITTKLPNNKVKATGTTVMTFTSTADYTLPSVPSPITNECEKKKYQQAIDTTLRAHEEKHKAAFLTYNGTVSANVNVTADNDTALLAAVTAATLDPTTDSRYNAAKKKSADVDPPGGFKFTPDLSGC